MSQLQWALLIAGAVIILAVIIYNKWLEIRADRRAREGDDPADPLLSPTRSTTILGAEIKSGTLTPLSAHSLSSPSVAEHGFDEDIEQIVSMSFDTPVLGDTVLEASRGFERAGAKPVNIAATHSVSHKLEPVRPEEFYSGLHIGVLLANRSGPLNAIEYSEFVQGVQRVAEKLDLSVETPEMNDVLGQAKALDEQLAKLDMQMVIHIVANAASWPVETFARAAVEAGFAHRANGRFVYYRSGAEIFHMQAVDGEGRALSALPGSSGQAAALSITFDVPRAPEIENPFYTLMTVARTLAIRLGATIVDDHRRPVTDAAVAQVEAQLKPLYAQMRALGVEAGSPKALRLFA